MAIGWITVLQAVPWSQVIDNAPKLAEGAMKLWKTVAGKPAPEKPSAPGAHPSSDAQTLLAIEQRMAALETTATELQTQMRVSSELIKDLAEQNAQLVRRIEQNRVRVVWFSAVTGLALLFSAMALYLLLA